MWKTLIQISLIKYPTVKEKYHTNYKNMETYSPSIQRKANTLIMTNILKKIGIIWSTHGKELNSLFL